MAKGVIQGATILYGELELQAETSSFELTLTAEPKESTNLGSDGWREFLRGMKETGVDIEGMFDQAVVDLAATDHEAARAVLLSRSRPLVDGDRAWAVETARSQYRQGWQVGEIQGYTLGLRPTGPLVRGVALHVATLDASANGDGQELGAISATQRGYGGLFVLSATGTAPTLDAVIQSDAADTWGGAETDRITFDQATGTASAAWRQWKTLSGPVTDTWWRLKGTIGGTGPSVRFVAFFGIGSIG